LDKSFFIEKDNFLSDQECDFLINYHKRFYNESTCGNYWNGTYVMRMRETPLFHLKKSLIRRFYLKKITKNFPQLKLNYDQVVYWSPGSFLKLHYDKDYPDEGAINDFVTLCYLNDDYEGGKTLIEDKSIKPKKGKLVVFPSKKMEHGVSLVKGKSRYTYIAWWKEK